MHCGGNLGNYDTLPIVDTCKLSHPSKKLNTSGIEELVTLFRSGLLDKPGFAFAPREGSTQCYNCQETRHKAFACKKPQTCGSCAEQGHSHKTCQAALLKTLELLQRNVHKRKEVQQSLLNDEGLKDYAVHDRKRHHTDSVPHPGQAQARAPPAVLHSIADASFTGVANIEEEFRNSKPG
ncbi:hypothetical protein VTI74DRAFT_4958 [Chaetomium olivicolor]